MAVVSVKEQLPVHFMSMGPFSTNHASKITGYFFIHS